MVDELVKGTNKLIQEMKEILHEWGVFYIAMGAAIIEFERRHPHLSKSAIISYFNDAMDISKDKAFREFRKRV